MDSRKNRKQAEIKTQNAPEGSVDRPSSGDLRHELKRQKEKKRFFRTVRDIIFVLITVAAAAVLISTLVLPVLRIYGTSMTPTLEEGDMVAAVKSGEMQAGDLVAFYYNNKILVKRVIATSGEWVNIEDDGSVYVNGELLEEPYIAEKSKGQCDIELPIQVPDGKIFVMGDHREVSVDSRTNAIGFISQEQIVGKLIFRFWPLSRIGIPK